MIEFLYKLTTVCSGTGEVYIIHIRMMQAKHVVVEEL